MKHKPALVIHLTMPGWSYDINVSVDKREVHLIGSDVLASKLHDALVEAWEPTRQSMLVGQGGLGLS